MCPQLSPMGSVRCGLVLFCSHSGLSSLSASLSARVSGVKICAAHLLAYFQRQGEVACGPRRRSLSSSGCLLHGDTPIPRCYCPLLGHHPSLVSLSQVPQIRILGGSHRKCAPKNVYPLYPKRVCKMVDTLHTLVLDYEININSNDNVGE